MRAGAVGLVVGWPCALLWGCGAGGKAAAHCCCSLVVF